MSYVRTFEELISALEACGPENPVFARYTFLTPADVEKTLYLAFKAPVGEMHTQSGSIVAADALTGFETSPRQVQGDVTFTYAGILLAETCFYPEMFVSLELIDRSQVPVGLFWAEEI